MAKDFTRVRPPKETREQLVSSIRTILAEKVTRSEVVEFLLAFFTRVDLRLILDQLEEESKN